MEKTASPLGRKTIQVYKIKPKFDIEPPTNMEINKYIQKTKRRETPGPGQNEEHCEIPIEFLKELDDDGIEELRKCIGTWWEKENTPLDFLKARVVLISKKGLMPNLKTSDPSPF